MKLDRACDGFVWIARTEVSRASYLRLLSRCA